MQDLERANGSHKDKLESGDLELGHTNAASSSPALVRGSRWRPKDYTGCVPSQSLLYPLYTISFVTGMLDPGTYATFHTFSSNQTGNVILLTLVAASDTSLENHNTVASLGSYLIIGFLAGQLGHWIGLRRKWWLMLSNLLQTMLLAVVCIIHASGALPWTDVNRQWALLIPVAAAAGLQVAISRNCGNGEVPTAMLSSPMIDLITDKNIFKPAWSADPVVRPRNARLCYITALIGGAFVGAFVHRHFGFLIVLVVSIAIKTLITLWICFLPVEALSLP